MGEGGGGNLGAMDYHPIEEGVEIPLDTECYRIQDKLLSCEPLWPTPPTLGCSGHDKKLRPIIVYSNNNKVFSNLIRFTTHDSLQ